MFFLSHTQLINGPHPAVWEHCQVQEDSIPVIAVRVRIIRGPHYIYHTPDVEALWRRFYVIQKRTHPTVLCKNKGDSVVKRRKIC